MSDERDRWYHIPVVFSWLVPEIYSAVAYPEVWETNFKPRNLWMGRLIHLFVVTSWYTSTSNSSDDVMCLGGVVMWVWEGKSTHPSKNWILNFENDCETFESCGIRNKI